MYVPVAQLDKASDYESEDWGFKSLQGYPFPFQFFFPYLHNRIRKRRAAV